MSLKGKDVISIDKFSIDELSFILDTTLDIKNDIVKNGGRPDKDYKKLLRGKKLISAFFEDSTRTRTSFNEAIKQLGGSVDGFAGITGTSVNKGESIYHTIKMLEGYGADAIVVRHKLEGTAQFLADKFNIPVINAGDGAHEHPTQTILDLFTIRETQGRLDNLTVSLVGDLKYGRTVHSLSNALSMFENNKIRLVSPKEISMPEKFLNVLKKRNVEFYETNDLASAVRDSDIVYTTRIQKERLPLDLLPMYDSMKTSFRIDKNMLKDVKDNLKILHPLPIPKDVQEIANDVENTKYCYYFDQAQNGLYARMAILGLVLGKIKSPDFKNEVLAVEYANFKSVNLKQKSSDDKKIEDITNGLILDHLPPGSSENVVNIMDYGYMDNVFSGRNLKSTKYGKKDLIKIESKNFDLNDLEPLNKLALLYPNATVNLVKDGTVVRKGRVELPSEITDLVVCPNGDCVTRPEYFETDNTKFYVNNRDPLLLECHYCGHEFSRDKIVIKKH